MNSTCSRNTHNNDTGTANTSPHDETHTPDHNHGDHNHGGVADIVSAGGKYRSRLFGAFVVTAVFTLVQGTTAIFTDSLSLLSDTAHMLTDVLGLGLALAAVEISRRVQASPQRSFGAYRLEVLAAMVNSVLLITAGVYALVEAVSRIGNTPDVPAAPVLIVATLGLCSNLVAFALLRNGAEESMNVEGAYLEVLSDLLGSVAVILAAAVMWSTGWGWIDTVVGVGIGLVILPRAWQLGRNAVDVLLQSAPRSTDVALIQTELESIDGVTDVHDLHVWSLTSGLDVATGHLQITPGGDVHTVLDAAQATFERHELAHTTLQIEPSTHKTEHEPDW